MKKQRDINDTFEAWLKNPLFFKDHERKLMEAYKECVINNKKTVGNLNLTLGLTGLFEIILNKL